MTEQLQATIALLKAQAAYLEATATYLEITGQLPTQMPPLPAAPAMPIDGSKLPPINGRLNINLNELGLKAK